ncbi:hypothetical protein EVAR_29122_1 [Eumeta japonica]|uniref:Uncharacterized protein n=1 Tax=Eumeta variegata TaxID=151549 RepID=A0A4C1VB51_EUMVA|nr:hypothetical protein EVAR_29122_1 [Eumeta japonica]
MYMRWLAGTAACTETSERVCRAKNITIFRIVPTGEPPTAGIPDNVELKKVRNNASMFPELEDIIAQTDKFWDLPARSLRLFLFVNSFVSYKSEQWSSNMNDGGQVRGNS